MLKEKIKYTDFNGVEREEEFYFHLSLPEVTRLEAKFGMPISEYAQQIAKDQDVSKLLAFLELTILEAYGKKSMDGRSFHKSEDLRKEFEFSQAYAELFEQMILNPDKARRFGELVADTGKAKKNKVEPTVVSPTNN